MSTEFLTMYISVLRVKELKPEQKNVKTSKTGFENIFENQNYDYTPGQNLEHKNMEHKEKMQIEKRNRNRNKNSYKNRENVIWNRNRNKTRSINIKMEHGNRNRNTIRNINKKKKM